MQVCRQLSSRTRMELHLLVFITKEFVTMHGHMNVKPTPDGAEVGTSVH
jgi:hypothetical protein